MNRRYFWLKLKADFFKDVRIKKLRQLAGGAIYTIIYLKLQLLSLEDEGNLYFFGVEDEFTEELALAIDESPEDVKVCVMYLIKTGLIEEISENEYSLTETKMCIGSETQSTIRSRKCRNNQKTLQCNTNATHLQQIATNCNVEKRRDREEIEIEKDVDIYSIYENEISQLSPIQYEKLANWEKELNRELIFEAIRKASDNNKRSFSYIEAILKSWKAKGFKTLADTKNEVKKKEVVPTWIDKEVKTEEISQEAQEEYERLFGKE